MKWLLLTLYLLVLACRLWLRHLNLQQLKAHGHEVPAGFEGIVDRQLLARTSAYTLATSRVGLIESLFSNSLRGVSSAQILSGWASFIKKAK